MGKLIAIEGEKQQQDQSLEKEAREYIEARLEAEAIGDVFTQWRSEIENANSEIQFFIVAIIPSEAGEHIVAHRMGSYKGRLQAAQALLNPD